MPPEPDPSWPHSQAYSSIQQHPGASRSTQKQKHPENSLFNIQHPAASMWCCCSRSAFLGSFIFLVHLLHLQAPPIDADIATRTTKTSTVDTKRPFLQAWLPFYLCSCSTTCYLRQVTVAHVLLLLLRPYLRLAPPVVVILLFFVFPQMDEHPFKKEQQALCEGQLTLGDRVDEHRALWKCGVMVTVTWDWTRVMDSRAID